WFLDRTRHSRGSPEIPGVASLRATLRVGINAPALVLFVGICRFRHVDCVTGAAAFPGVSDPGRPRRISAPCRLERKNRMDSRAAAVSFADRATWVPGWIQALDR